MTLRFVDSYDHYVASVDAGGESGAGLRTKYAQATGVAYGSVGVEAGGRFGGQRLASGAGGAASGAGYVVGALGVARATWIAGVAFQTPYYPPAGAYVSLLGFTSGLPGVGGAQCYLFMGPGGYLAVGTDPAVILGTSAYRPPVDAWVYLQLKVTVGAAGSYEVRASDTPVLTGTGDTQALAATTADGVLVGSVVALPGFTQVRFDDLYVCDTDGARNNDFLGDTRITCLFPTGAGAWAQFAPSAGANHQTVDDPATNQDTDYNASSTPGQQDSFAMGDLADLGLAVRGVQWVAVHRKDDAGARALRRLLRAGGTDYAGAADAAVLDTYQVAREVLETSPATGTDWTVAGVNALEAGYRLQS